jgi:AcrR family transcriptional regulator
MNVAAPGEKPAIRGPGRPRDEEVRRRILSSAAKLLESGSFAGITMDAIAEHSGAGKATLYRWWSNKEAVLIEAFRESVSRELPLPDAGSLQEDVGQRLYQFAQIMTGSRGRIFSAVIAAAQNDREVAEAFRQFWLAPRRAEAKQALERYRDSGELAPELDLDCVIEMVFSPLYYRLLFGWGPITESYIESLCETALKGLMQRF